MGSDTRRLVRCALLTALILTGSAGRVAALNNPNQFCIGDPCVISSAKDVDPGALLDFGTRAVVLQSTLTLLPLPSGAIGSVTIKAGSFSITGSNGQIRGFSGSAAAGQVEIDVVNDILIAGTIGTGAVRLSGQDGGTLTLTTTTGSVGGGGRMDLSGNSTTASAGTLTVSSAADINFSGEIDMNGGAQGCGGDLELTAVGDTSVTGFLDLSGGGDGGCLDISGGGSLTMGRVDMSGTDLDASGGLALVDVGGDVKLLDLYRGRGADAGADCGDGADVDIAAGGDITIAGDMDIRGRGLDCSGGYLTLAGASVFLSSALQLSATGSEGDGGDLDVFATTLIRLTGSVAVDGGEGGGGAVVFFSMKDAEILGTIDATGRTSSSPGAAQAEFDAGKLTVSGTIDASGGSSAVPGGLMLLAACDVITTPTAVIKSVGDLGAITVQSSDTIMLRGHFTAAANGGITVRSSHKSNPPNTAGAIFAPAPTLILDNAIIPCRVCDTNADCADGNPCTDDLCSNFTACLNPQRSGACEDGDLCTSGDTCVAGVCVSGPPTSCNDQNPCTADSCASALGCQHAPAAGACSDGDLCTTGDVCAAGTCVSTPINCGDGNPCTDDVCSAGVCNHSFNTAPCGAGNACTSQDTCQNGVCVAGPQVSCNDNDVCTTDSCNVISGCQHAPITGCVDSDHDGKVDGADECTTLMWTPLPITPPNQNPLKFGLKLKRLASSPGSQSILMKGLFNVAPSSQLPIDPTANGLHIYAEDASGPLLSVSLPGGAGCTPGDGWTTLGTGFHKTWLYRNRSGTLPPGCTAGSGVGIASVQIKDFRRTSKAGLQFKIKTKNAALLRGPTPPLTRLEVVVALAAQPAPGVASPQAKAGQCAEALLTGNPISSTTKPSCKTILSGAVIDSATCKGK